MDNIQVQNIKIELIKINAVKIIPEREKQDREDKDPIDIEPEKENMNSVNITFKQSEKNQNIDFHVIYTIPLTSKKKISLDAEFNGTIVLSSDIDLDEVFSNDDKKWFHTNIVSNILKAVDHKLGPIFNSMDIDYKKLS